jgi:IS5 family transposase
VCERWVYDPYFQHFTGEEFFQHLFPHERSDLSHWRKRLGDKLELLLAESLRVAHATGALRTRDLKRVTVDTTVQPKAITFPTDAKLLHAAIKGLNRLAGKCGVRLRQSYCRIAKRAVMMASRYAHAKQFNRHHRQLRLLRSRLGRIIRDIRRKLTQDRRPTPARDDLRRAALPRCADPFAAAAAMWVETLFLPCP